MTLHESPDQVESYDPILTRLYDNNSDPRNQSDLRELQRASAEALLDPAIDVSILRWGPDAHQWVHRFAPPSARNPLPTLVFVHGGRWQLNTSAETSFWARTCVDQGWTMISINFPPLSDRCRLVAQIEAVDQALEQVGSNALAWGLDPARMALAGHSSGAHLALAASLANPSPWRALLLVGGLYDLEPLTRTDFQDALRWTPVEVDQCSPLRRVRHAGGAISTNTWPEVMVAVGAQETAEFRRQSRELHDALATCASTRWFEVPVAAHFDAPLEFTGSASLMRAFVSSHLGDTK
jgi:arylformamidase